MNILLVKSSLKYFITHPFQTFLSILGIALGIAVSTGIDTANQSTLKAFKYSMNAVTGNAAAHIINTGSDIDSSYYFKLRNLNFRNISPVIEEPVKVKKNTFILFGTDPFASSSIQSRFSGIEFIKGKNIASLISDKNGVIISQKTSENMNLDPGDSFFIEDSGKKHKVKVYGVIKAKSGRINYDHIILADISTAQEILGKDTISRIDIFDKKDEKKLKKIISENHIIISSESRSNTTEQMISSFQINLSALSLLAIIVGFYLIYNTMSFSVVRRHRTLGIYKCLGVYKKEIFLIILFESLLLGIPGTIAGLLLGFSISKGLVLLVSKSLNDLYFAMSVNSVTPDFMVFSKGLALGLAASAAAGLKPAIEAMQLPAAFSMKRSSQEERIKSKISVYSFLGIVMLFITIIMISIDTKSIIWGYSSFIPLIAGFTLLSPLAVVFCVKIFSFINFSSSLIHKMGLKSVTESLSRTVSAITALALAVSATIGVGLTIASFRTTVFDWLDKRLGADVYISAPSLISLKNDNPLKPYLLDEIKKIQEIDKINYYREKDVYLNDKKILATGFSLHEDDRSRFDFTEKTSKNIWKDFLEGKGVIITEPFAVKNDLKPGMHLKFDLNNKENKYKILGIYTDYSSDQGRVSFSYDEFSRLFKINDISGISLFLKNNSDFETIKNKIINASKGEQLIINSNSALKKNSMKLFDQTFAIAGILQAISIIVAFTGIVAALMSIMLEKEKEIGVLRAIGFYSTEIKIKVYIQTFYMGLISAIMAIPLGHIFSWILINIINKRAFGWSIDFSISYTIILQSLLVAVLGALAAGIYPASKMSKIIPAHALREE
ncbi:MAG: ABC transporter permease [Thermodesulfobacteriota bacterium]